MSNKQAIKILRDLALSQKMYGTPEQYKACVKGITALKEQDHMETVSAWLVAGMMGIWIVSMIVLWLLGF